MLSVCKCLIMDGCSSKRNQQSCFLKKPLVAISLFVIVTMCLTLTEAAPGPLEHRRRHHRRQTESSPYRTKELQGNRNPSIEPFRNATEVIITRLKNNMRFYCDNLHMYKTIRNIKGNPTWLPKVNFKVIHSHQSKNIAARFKYIMPKLYKHIMEYRTIFELLNKVQIKGSSNLDSRRQKRGNFLNSTIIRLDLLLTDIMDGMDSVQMPVPGFDRNEMNLSDFHKIVDDTRLDYQDNFAFRGYEHLLKYWRLELRCWKKNPQTMKRNCMCLKYHVEMEDMRNNVPRSQRKKVKCESVKKRSVNRKLNRHRHQIRRQVQENTSS